MGGHEHNEILLNHKWWLPVICRGMGGPGVHYIEWSKSSPERHTPYVLSYKWLFKMKAISIKQKAERSQSVLCFLCGII